MFVRNVETVKSMKFDLLVCDEGHRLKNANIKTASVSMSIHLSGSKHVNAITLMFGRNLI